MKSGCWVSMCSRVPRFDGSRDSLEPPVFSGDSPVNRGFEKAASFSILPNLFPYWSKDLIFICLQVIFFLKALYDYPRKKGGGERRGGEWRKTKCQVSRWASSDSCFLFLFFTNMPLLRVLRKYELSLHLSLFPSDFWSQNGISHVWWMKWSISLSTVRFWFGINWRRFFPLSVCMFVLFPPLSG